MKERFIGVSWQEPVKWSKRGKFDHESLQLYQIYGRHPIYGADVLLYIGMSDGIASRLNHHDNWVQFLPDTATVTAACLKEFTSWTEYDDPRYDDDYFEPCSREVVAAVESLLIYAHAPVYNKAERAAPKRSTEGLRIFNTGHHRSLMPELSYFGLIGEGETSHEHGGA
jgi:hypothetical protein